MLSEYCEPDIYMHGQWGLVHCILDFVSKLLVLSCLWNNGTGCKYCHHIANNLLADSLSHLTLLKFELCTVLYSIKVSLNCMLEQILVEHDGYKNQSFSAAGECAPRPLYLVSTTRYWNPPWNPEKFLLMPL